MCRRCGRRMSQGNKSSATCCHRHMWCCQPPEALRRRSSCNHEQHLVRRIFNVQCFLVYCGVLLPPVVFGRDPRRRSLKCVVNYSAAWQVGRLVPHVASETCKLSESVTNYNGSCRCQPLRQLAVECGRHDQQQVPAPAWCHPRTLG